MDAGARLHASLWAVIVRSSDLEPTRSQDTKSASEVSLMAMFFEKARKINEGHMERTGDALFRVGEREPRSTMAVRRLAAAARCLAQRRRVGGCHPSKACSARPSGGVLHALTACAPCAA